MALPSPLVVRDGEWFALCFGLIPLRQRLRLAWSALLGRTQRVHQPVAIRIDGDRVVEWRES